MDSIPIVEVLARCDSRFARARFRWFFLGQTEKPAERLINANPGAWYTTTSEHMGEEAFADYAGRFTIPRRGMCEDYRAGLAIDWKHDEADRARGTQGQRPDTPLVVGGRDLVELFGDPLAIWREWADDVRADSIDSGHDMAEEAPVELAEKLRVFLSDISAITRGRSHSANGVPVRIPMQ
jgi:haloacetate dehalogenase